MRVFIAGATGVLGRRVVDLLVAAGHQVAGLSRSQANTDWLADHGAVVLPGDLFNRDQIMELTAGYDAILHLATAIPTKAHSSAADWATNDRIRRDGTANLVDAAVAHRARLYVQQSIAFLYGDHGAAWIDEETPIIDDSHGPLGSAVDMEHLVSEAVNTHGLPAVNLRFGSFYSADAADTQAVLAAAQQGIFPNLGDGTAYTSLCHVDDAALAIARVIEKFPAGLGQTFNVCDDEPATTGAIATTLAALLGSRPPHFAPRPPADSVAGTAVPSVSSMSLRCRNDLFRNTFSWSPRYPSYREGYKATVAAWRAEPQGS